MNNYRIDPKKQFSKRLARWTAVFWFLFMSWLSIIMFIAPEAALYSVYMAIIVTVVMILNVWAYTKNSIYEKSMFAMLDKTKLELSLKGSAETKVDADIDDNDDSEEEQYDEEGGNG